MFVKHQSCHTAPPKCVCVSLMKKQKKKKKKKNTHCKRTSACVSVRLRVQAYGSFLEAVQVDWVQTELVKNGMLFMCFRHFRITATHMTKYMLKVCICVGGCMRDCAPCTLKVWFLFQKGLRETGKERETCSHISTCLLSKGECLHYSSRLKH